eukprot:gene34340-44360_t
MDQPLPQVNNIDWDQNNYKQIEKCTICCPCKCTYVTTRICCLSCKDCCKVLCCQRCFPPPRPSWNTTFYLAISVIGNVVTTMGELRTLTGIRLFSNGGPPRWIIPRGLHSKIGTSLEAGTTLPAYEFTYSDDEDLNLLFSPAAAGNSNNSSRRKYVLFFHGGAFCWQTIASHRMLCYEIAKETGASVLAVEYRKAPEYPYPIPGRDCFDAYKWLLGKVGDSSRIIVSGDSAGGALTIDVVLQARDAGIPRPGGCILMSPWVDLMDEVNDSLTRNQEFDILPANLTTYVAGLYVDPKIASTISAINQDLRDFPPVLVEVGDAEILLDQILKFVEKLKEDAARSSTATYVECSVHKDMTHSFQMLKFTNMSQISESFMKMKSFIDRLDELN